MVGMPYSLDTLSKRWGKKSITELLEMAVSGELALSVFYRGLVSYTQANYAAGFPAACSPYNGWATIPPPEVYKLRFSVSNIPVLCEPGGDRFYPHKPDFVPLSDVVVQPEEVDRIDAKHPEWLSGCDDTQVNEATIAKVLNPKHPWHSEPLAHAVKAWLELYANRDGNRHDNAYRPPQGNTVYVNKWLTDNIDKNMGDTTRGHYCYVINPSKQGGSKRNPE